MNTPRINPAQRPQVENVTAVCIEVRESESKGKNILVFWVTTASSVVAHGPLWAEVPDWCQDLNLLVQKDKPLAKSRIALRPANDGDADIIWCHTGNPNSPN